MRVAMLTRGWLPFPTGFGSAIHVWSFTESLRKRGHELHLCCYGFDPMLGKTACAGAAHVESRRRLEVEGVHIHLIEANPASSIARWRTYMELARSSLRPETRDFYPGCRYAVPIHKILREIRPDGICAWTVDAVAATAEEFAPHAPRLAFLTDLDYLARRYRRRLRPAHRVGGRISQWAQAFADRRLPALMVSLLQGCPVVFDHAAHHCRWLQDHGVPQARYLPVPVPDRGGPDWREARSRHQRNQTRLRIVLIGNVTGIATLPGLQLTAQEILPQLERLAPRDQFEVHVIGGGNYPVWLARAFDKPYVRLRGYVDDISGEFLASDIFLVPTPIDLGFRTRIAEAFSFGCCVVAHEVNALGMPELVNGQNALLARTGPELAAAVTRCLVDPALRTRLETAGREEFERGLDGERVSNQMVEAFEEMVRRFPATWETN